MYKPPKFPRGNRYLLFIAALVTISPPSGFADEAKESPVLRVVFFTPSDVDPPQGVRERLKEHVDYAQFFYGKWMKHWGYESQQPLRVNQDKNGLPEVLFVRGRHAEASGRYRQLGFEGEVVESACRSFDIDPAGQVWWIFIYKGPERRGFRGGGNASRGGRSTSIFDPDAVGTLRIDDELGSDGIRMNSKASVHELGHALGLPHIGPLQNDKLGNSLMGPIVRAYRQHYPTESRVYLTKASAAMLWKHPLFSGTNEDRQIKPKLEIKDFKVTHDKERDTMVVRGKIVSDRAAHSVIVANESSSLRSDYWRQCFAERIVDDGTFEIAVNELDESDGQLRVVCCFNNGAVVGENGGLGLQAGFAKQYRFKNGVFTFEDGWATPEARRRGARGGRPNRKGIPRPQ